MILHFNFDLVEWKQSRSGPKEVAVIICHCLRISDRTIRTSVREGAETREQVARACGAGSCCGSCRPAIDEIVCEERGCAPRLVLLSFDSASCDTP
jgi:bacterioferritin-associated ferredoxin